MLRRTMAPNPSSRDKAKPSTKIACQVNGLKNHCPSTGQVGGRKRNRQRGEVERKRERHEQRPGEAIDNGKGGRHKHENDVQRQDVEIAELMREQHDAHLHMRGIEKERGRVVPLENERVVGVKRQWPRAGRSRAR